MAFFQFFRDYKIQIAENVPTGTLEFSVPIDKELIIEFASGSGNMRASRVSFVFFQLIPPHSSGGADSPTGAYFIPVQSGGSNDPSADIFMFAQSMHVHIDAGTKVLITLPVGIGQGSFTMTGNFTMTGQILDAGSSGASVSL